MHCVSIDLFSFGGHEYVVMADRYSFYIWCSKLNNTATSDILKAIDKWFLEAVYPRQIISDNGPQFRTEFHNYCKDKGIIHEPSSPLNPRSNGLAELAVKAAKHLLSKSDNYGDFHGDGSRRRTSFARNSFSRKFRVHFLENH